MKITQTIKYGVGQLVLIVTGVMLALAATAWWEGRGKIENEEFYLRQLLMDAAGNSRRLREAIGEDENRHRVVGRLVHSLDPTNPLPVRDSLNHWWSQNPFGWSAPRLVLGTSRALVESGEFRLIRSPHLRAALVAYVDEVEGDLRSLEIVEERHWVSVSRFLERAEPVRVYDAGANYELDFAATASMFRADPVARSSLRDLWMNHYMRVYYLTRMADQTSAVHDLLAKSGHK